MMWGDSGVVVGICRAGVVALGLSIAGGAAAGVVANATYIDINGNTKSIQIDGVVNQSGWAWFNKVVVDGPLTFTWNYNVDLDPNGNAVFNGSTKTANASIFPVVSGTSIQFNLCPGIDSNTVLGGTANIKLFANVNGGAVTCGLGTALTGVLLNGAPYVTNYWCPFLMTSGGAGTAQTSATFGQPIPSLLGPIGNVSSVGHFTNFTITDGDAVLFTAYTVAAGATPDWPAANCGFDINGDGTVDKWDLVALLISFGDAGPCLPADLNDNGIVDAADLGLLLGSWGQCPN